MQILHNEIYAISINDDIGIFKCRCYLPQTFEYEFESISEIRWKVIIPIDQVDSGKIKLTHLTNVRQLIE